MSLRVLNVAVVCAVVSTGVFLSQLTTVFATPPGAIPLIDMTSGQTYLGFSGGLYPNGSNTMPASHHDAGLAQAQEITPRDINGTPTSMENGGAIVLLTIGMSNTAAESQTFQAFAENDWHRSPAVRVLNGAAPSQTALYWDQTTDANYDRIRDTVLGPAGFTQQQVQAIWLKTANASPTIGLASGTSSADAYALESSLGNIVRTLKVRYPNLKQVFLSSRMYGGYASSNLNPEPYAYESGFSVKWMIESQMTQATSGTTDGRAGDLTYTGAAPVAPWTAWGPYIWADGTTPNGQGLSYVSSDFDSGDGTHPSLSGRQKVATSLINFFIDSPYTSWYRDPSATQPAATNINLSVYGTANNFQWTTTGTVGNPGGFVIVFSKGVANPTYPVTTGVVGYSRSYSSGTPWTAWITPNDNTGVYHVRVCAVGPNSTCSEYSNQLNVTLAGTTSTDTVAPLLSGLNVNSIGLNSATIGWTTHEVASTIVQYGLTVSYGATSTNTALTTGHSVPVTGLTSGTLYHYRVCSRDGNSNQTCSADATFTTAIITDTTAPVISSLAVESAITNATVTWATDEAATQWIDLDTDAGVPYAVTQGTSSTPATTHSVILTGLSPNTTYYYRVRSADTYGNQAVSDEYTFTTLPDVTAPVISNLQWNPGVFSASVTWSTDEASQSRIEYGFTSELGEMAANTALSTSHSETLSGLFLGTEYFVRVCAIDGSSNEACTDVVSLTTLIPDLTAPMISDLQVNNLTTSTAMVTWTTDEAASSWIDLDTDSGAPYAVTTGTGALTTSHTLTLTGLPLNTTQYFRVRSADASTNEVSSDEGAFTTLADTVAPVITNVSISATTTSATITWTTNEASTQYVDFDTVVGPPYLSTTGTSALGIVHSVTLTGLTASTTYHYRIRSADAYANESAGLDASFTTVALPPAQSITLTKATGLNRVDWTVTGGLGNPGGFMLVFSRTQDPPVYPATSGVSSYFRPYSPSSNWNAWLSAFNGPGIYHARVCVLQAGNVCTNYSNQIDLNL